jgi:hypothetical protein
VCIGGFIVFDRGNGIGNLRVKPDDKHAPDTGDRISQRPGVGLDVRSELRAETARQHKIDLAVQDTFKLLGQRKVVAEAAVVRQVDQQIDIAVRTLLAPGNRAEQAQVPSFVHLRPPRLWQANYPLAFACNPHHHSLMPQARKSNAPPRRPTRRGPSGASNPRAKVAITVRLDAAAARQLQAVAEAENRSLTNYVETALLRDLARREEADRVITMYVAPGASTTIRPEDVVRAEGESDEEYAERQALAVELWSIPHNA